jgi:hypothetical protein
LVEDVRPISRISPSTCWKSRYNTRSDTSAIMPGCLTSLITAGQGPCPTSGTPQAPDGLEPVTLQATSAHDALHDAVDLIEALSQHADVAISSMHTLDGDPAAWVTLAAAKASSTAPSPTAPSPT